MFEVICAGLSDCWTQGLPGAPRTTGTSRRAADALAGFGVAVGVDRARAAAEGRRSGRGGSGGMRCAGSS